MLDKVIEMIESSEDGGSTLYKAFDAFKESSNGLFWQEKDTLNIYRFEDYFVRFGMIFNTEVLRQRLLDIADWGISCAPEFIYYKSWKRGETVMITRIKGFISHGNAWSYMRHREEVSDIAKENLLKDVDRMLERNGINPVIPESAQNWYIIPDTGEFYIDDWCRWDMVVSTREKRTVRNEIRQMLGI